MQFEVKDMTDKIEQQDNVTNSEDKHSKNYVIMLFVLFAIPIPISLISWIPTLMSLAAIGMIDWTSPLEIMRAIIAFSAMILAGSYLVPYIWALGVSLSEKKISKKSFVPLFYIVITLIMFLIWGLS